MKRFPVLMLVGLLGLTACSSTAPEHVPASDNPSAEAEAPQGSEEMQSAEEKTQKKNLTVPFGDTYKWPHGHEITVGKPEEFTISNEFTREMFEGKTVKLKVTHVNNSEEPYEAADVSYTATSGGKAAEQVFADEDEVDVPIVEIMPGDSLTYYIGFQVEDPKDLTLKVLPEDYSIMDVIEPGRFSTRAE